ncbi:DNA cytosine methyltransferase [Halomarina oriensis]|uniref:DNA (cytosine-5-)-methyltransferase n=1 Tax=Halomarina oriensis TaxID=671145 RepID=A0A6B0GMX4_9EURY|nr:DNA (cytosine-5-)-methyltransferase [Halomarina oriensis]MWG36222.1 DNA (cytosine-5-)-methyltransferase [Halomarina oriensis]
MRTDSLVAVDLFCGGGGFSTALALACEQLERDARLIAINHWTKAIETHKRNHPWAEHHNAKVEELHPPAVVGKDDVDLLVGGPECTHFSSARGGKPVNEQKRASPWHVVDWVQKTRPKHLIIENVPELESWGPVDEDGKPSRNGETFEAWINALHSLGYSMDWDVLNAADYGDATKRRRLFIVGQRNGRATFPTPTHSKTPDEDTAPWRRAADILNHSHRGGSVWERSRPLSDNTMQRIAQGLREHCGDEVAAFADAIEELTPDDVHQMQEDIVAVDDLDSALVERTEPFFVAAPAVAADGGSVAESETGTRMVMGQQSNARALDADDAPVPTIATRGAIHYIEAEPFVKPRNGPRRGLHSNATYQPDERPLHTVTAKNHDGHLVSPFLVEYYGNSDTASLSDPVPTVTTKDRHALCVPELSPWGLDLRYRMLQPDELAAAQGFPPEYEFVGNKGETTEQIGNAVPVNMAKALIENVLTDEAVSLTSFGNEEVPTDD